MSQDDKHYQMWWDCRQCGSKGLLGLSHRHCPECGAAQRAEDRYFPPPGQEVEAKQHRYTGIDWQCRYCDSPNAALAKFCVNCSAGQDGSQPVALVQDRATPPVAAPPAPSAPTPPRKSHGMWIVAAVLLAVLASVVTGFMYTRDNAVTLVSKTWERSIDIERLVEQRDADWCDAMPSDAYSVLRSRELRSHRDVPNGQICSEERVDNGDGSFSKRQSCSTTYRSEPVYDMRCTYKVMRWQSQRRVVANQLSHPQPAWPAVTLLAPPPPSAPLMSLGSSTTKRLGSEREGRRQETYKVDLQGQTAKDRWSCAVNADLWNRLTEGETLTLPVRLIGGAACAQLR